MRFGLGSLLAVYAGVAMIVFAAVKVVDAVVGTFSATITVIVAILQQA